MTIGIWILGDQLAADQAALQQANGSRYPVILIESTDYARQRPYHRQKLVLVWSAMRHFAAELRDRGWSVTYELASTFQDPLLNWIDTEGIDNLWIMEPSDRPFRRLIEQLDLPCKITWIPNNQFLWTSEDFQQWASRRKSLLMESFYREGRKRFDVLMDGKDPVGGQWNLDKQNRKPPKGKLDPPSPLTFPPDEITQTAIAQVRDGDFSSYGDLDSFGWAVTRSQALQVLDHFIQERLPNFGTYQDAMVTGEDTLWHSLLSPYLNLGLLHPREVIQAVETAYGDRNLPLNSVEGFIRQVLGWREYMRGIYHLVEDEYFERNEFDHQTPLPDFFWDGDRTDMNCLHQTLKQVERTSYAHHIQRLMILSNFALIAGLLPQAVEQWFHAAFIDAHDWVMQTNVLGMGVFADGGFLASKPYAASANYINRMSDYCQSCRYNKSDRTGEDACPFNSLYWDFLDRHREKLQSQGRMSFILKNLDRMADEELQAIRDRATWLRTHKLATLNQLDQ